MPHTVYLRIIIYLTDFIAIMFEFECKCKLYLLTAYNQTHVPHIHCIYTFIYRIDLFDFGISVDDRCCAANNDVRCKSEYIPECTVSFDFSICICIRQHIHVHTHTHETHETHDDVFCPRNHLHYTAYSFHRFLHENKRNITDNNVRTYDVTIIS